MLYSSLQCAEVKYCTLEKLENVEHSPDERDCVEEVAGSEQKLGTWLYLMYEDLMSGMPGTVVFNVDERRIR